MGWLRYLPTLAVLAAVSWAGSELLALKRDRDALAAENAVLERSARVLELERDQAREARAVADAWRARDAADAERFREIKESIRKGPDDEIPDWYLDRLRELGVVRAGGDGD